MAQQSSVPRRSRPSRRIPVPNRPSERPSVSLLDIQQLDRFHKRAERAMAKTVAAYANLPSKVDTTRWKCFRSKQNLRLFRARRGNKSGRIPLMCVGTLHGRFDDVMEGLYCQNTEEMLLMNAIKCPRLGESAVLYTVQRQTTTEPYAFTGIKWASIKLSVPSNRDLCYFDKMGMVRQTSGKRMAYHMMQSVALPAFPSKPTHKRVQFSVCYLLEELEHNLVGVFMRGETDCSSLSYLGSTATTDVLLAMTNALECSRAKKLAHLVSEAPATTWSSTSKVKRCDVCRGVSCFEHFMSCASCKIKCVCKKCRKREHVLAREPAGSHLKRAEFCNKCMFKVETTSMSDLRDQKSSGTDVAVDDTLGKSLSSFSLGILAHVQQLNTCTNDRMSNLSSIGKNSICEDEEEIAVLEVGREQCALLHAKQQGHLSIADQDSSCTQSCGSQSSASTAPSSFYDSDDEVMQHQASLLTRLQSVSIQAEETFLLTRQHSRLVHTLLENRRTRGIEGSSFTPSTFWNT